MRTLVFSILSLLCAPALAAQTSVCSYERIPLDKRAEPTVPYYIVFLEQNQIRHVCEYEWTSSHDNIMGCAADNGDGSYNIYIEKRLDEANRACVIQHEKAHLPPNLWVHAGSYNLIPGPMYRRDVHLTRWRNYVATSPKLKPITYD
jgi:hypothetical protein